MALTCADPLWQGSQINRPVDRRRAGGPAEAEPQTLFRAIGTLQPGGHWDGRPPVELGPMGYRR